MVQQLMKLSRPDGPYDRPFIADMAASATANIPGITDIEIKAAIAEIESREQVTIGRPTKLTDKDPEHVDWYFGARRSEGVGFYNRYNDFLRQEGWGDGLLKSLDECTSSVMESLEDPKRAGQWDRRGLVLGHVQSGKTANYAGLLCKAADAGYRMLIVMTGMHRVLRQQTQLRLDRDFLGYKSTSIGATDKAWFGVGELDQRPIAHFITTRDSKSNPNGDFTRLAADRAGVPPESRPLLLVIKKNGKILENLNAWVSDFLAPRGDTRDIPLMVIDDEADQASVDTGEQEFIDGVPDPEYEPKRINGEIRKLLKAFSKSAYIAYTATPFANILAHDQRATEEHGADIFPESFIVNLPRPSSYVGPVEVFGINTQPDGRTFDAAKLDAFVSVNQVLENWLPQDHDGSYTPSYRGAERIPPSLEDAILSFLLVCAARRARGQLNKHNSMLIHVSRFKNLHRIVHSQVEDWFTATRRELSYQPEKLTIRLRKLWDGDFVPSAANSLVNGFDPGFPMPRWEAVQQELIEVMDRIKPNIKIVNGDSLAPLNYEDAEKSGLNVIAIGGDKLSRGLTLEGLSITYFLRASRMYDSLMQMGRWFGYRPGYVDLCRIYTTDDLQLYYRHVATAAEELREQLDNMVALGESPKDYGLKVQSHELLLVTARNKMRHAKEYKISFSGRGTIQTIFDVDTRALKANANKTGDFLNGLGDESERNRSIQLPNGSTVNWKNRYIWNEVLGTVIASWLRSLHFSSDSYDVSGIRMSEYILAQIGVNELTRWTVVLAANGEGPPLPLGKLDKVPTTQRTPQSREGRSSSANRYVVGTILDPKDESIDLDSIQYAAAVKLSNESREKKGKEPSDIPSGPAIRTIRGKGREKDGVAGDPTRGLVIIYPLDPTLPGIDIQCPIIGLVVSFPESENAQEVSYRFNSVLDRMELA